MIEKLTDEEIGFVLYRDAPDSDGDCLSCGGSLSWETDSGHRPDCLFVRLVEEVRYLRKIEHHARLAARYDAQSRSSDCMEQLEILDALFRQAKGA